MTEKILQIADLRKDFSENRVLNRINFELYRGEIISVIGTSGSGKTTLLKCIAGLLKPDNGKVKLNGDSIYAPSKYIGMVFQQFNLWPHKTVLDNVIEAPMLIEKKTKEEAVKEALAILKLVGLQEKANKYPHTLSGGQMQRAAIARALVMNPKILLLDEITSALDPELIDGINKIIRSLAKNSQTMIIVSHDMHFVREISDRVLFLDNGVILEEGKSSEILDNPRNSRTKQFLRRITNK